MSEDNVDKDTWLKLVDALEARGVDVDAFSDMIGQIRQELDRSGVSRSAQRDMLVKMLEFELEQPTKGGESN